MVITDLEFADAAYRRPPRQFSDDFALPNERIEINSMIGCPMVFLRICKHGLFVGDVRVFERKLAHSERGKPSDVLPHERFTVDVTFSHDAGRSYGHAGSRFKELIEGGSRCPHQSTIDRVIKVMPGKAQVRQSCICEQPCPFASEETAIRKTSNLVEEMLAPAYNVENGISAQQRFAATGHD